MTANRKHGLARSPEYKIWAMMKNKCLNKRSSNYCGNRGVKLFEPWVKFENFYSDLGPKPGPGYRLERYPNRKGNFEPGNVRWKLSGNVTQVSDEFTRDSKATKLIGKRLGKLEVVGVRRVRLGNGQLYAKVICKCDCGNTIEIFWTSLSSRVTKSCGCDFTYDKTTGENNYRFKGYKGIRAGFWNNYVSKATARGLVFNITKEYAWDLFESQERKCALSGVTLVLGTSKKGSITTASLDRVDSNLGYVEGNIQWVHKTLNIMRMALSVEEFVEWCHRVALQHPSIGLPKHEGCSNSILTDLQGQVQELDEAC
jgi:hypothetical protein